MLGKFHHSCYTLNKKFPFTLYLKMIKEFILPPYKARDLISLFLVVFLFLAIPLTILSTLQSRSYKPKAQTVVNDPQYPTQWNMTKIGMPAAWDLAKGKSSVKIAVIDTGILTTVSSDFNGQVGVGYNFVTPGGSTQDDAGSYGVGTLMASIIGAKPNNANHIAGINWNITMLPVKFCSATLDCNINLLDDAINWSVANGAQIIHISTGLTTTTPEIETAVTNAINNGVLVVAAAGNVATRIAYPAIYHNVIAVGATNSNDAIASFSGQGPNLDLVAPGQSVPVIVRGGCCITQSSTELAAAHVSGVLGLLLGAGVSSTRAQTCVLNSTVDLGTTGFDNIFGRGRLNAERALRQCAPYATDTDLDGFSDIIEANAGTDMTKKCGVDAFPPDVNNDGRVNVIDLQQVAIRTNQETYYPRYDMNANGAIETIDLQRVSVLIGTTCTPGT